MQFDMEIRYTYKVSEAECRMLSALCVCAQVTMYTNISNRCCLAMLLSSGDSQREDHLQRGRSASLTLWLHVLPEGPLQSKSLDHCCKCIHQGCNCYSVTPHTTLRIFLSYMQCVCRNNLLAAMNIYQPFLGSIYLLVTSPDILL